MHEQIEQYLLDKIAKQELKPGDQIPTENELAELFQTSRPTVRQALDYLKTEGYLMRYKGKGSFVTKPKVLHESTSFVAGYRKECEKKQQELITRVLCLEVIKAESEVAEKLGIEVGNKVIQLSRLRMIKTITEAKPVVLTTVYVPYNSFAFLMGIDFEQKSFYESMEEKGYKITHASRCLEVKVPSEEVAYQLKLNPFEPVIFISSVGKTAMEEKAEYSISYYPASSSQFLIEVNQ